MMELPSIKDFLEADLLRLLQPPNAHFSVAQYRKGKINMKIVVDFIEFDEKLILFDESRSDEFTKQMTAWQNSQNSPSVASAENGWTVTPKVHQPSPPTKEVTLRGTRVIYFNGQERVIMMPMAQWEDEYFAYLEVKKLNLP